MGHVEAHLWLQKKIKYIKIRRSFQENGMLLDYRANNNAKTQ